MQNAMAPKLTVGFYGFAVVSGIGWVLDMCLTMGTVQLGLPPFLGSLIGAATAVSFVYVVSRTLILGDGGLGHVQDFGLYVAWQVVAITVASGVVAVLAHGLEALAGRVMASYQADPLALASGLAKALVTPFTLLANYLFMRWLAGPGSRKRHGASKAPGDRGIR